MGKVLYTDFEEVEDVINSMMTDPGVKKAITRMNIYHFWDKVLPDKFKNKSRPYSMLPGGILVVACENAVVAQELALYKVKIMQKFVPYMKSLKMRMTDLKFDPQKWNLVEL